MKAIITKYAISSGVNIIEGEQVNSNMKMFEEKREPGRMSNYFHGKDWHTDKQSAIDDVRLRFEKRRTSLSKALSKLDDKMQSALATIEDAEI